MDKYKIKRSKQIKIFYMKYFSLFTLVINLILYQQICTIKLSYILGYKYVLACRFAGNL